MPRWLIRVAVAPFETLIGCLAVVTGLVGLLGVNSAAARTYDTILPWWAAAAFNVAYLLSGVALAVGVAWPRADVEAAGLIVVSTSSFSRALVLAALIGWTQAITTIALSLLVVAASGLRLWVLLPRRRPHG